MAVVWQQRKEGSGAQVGSIKAVSGPGLQAARPMATRAPASDAACKGSQCISSHEMGCVHLRHSASGGNADEQQGAGECAGRRTHLAGRWRKKKIKIM